MKKAIILFYVLLSDSFLIRGPPTSLTIVLDGFFKCGFKTYREKEEAS